MKVMDFIFIVSGNSLITTIVTTSENIGRNEIVSAQEIQVTTTDLKGPLLKLPVSIPLRPSYAIMLSATKLLGDNRCFNLLVVQKHAAKMWLH